MARVGYARVSSASQSLEVQLLKLKDCDKIFTEKISARTAKRPQLQAALDWVREGDVFIVTKLDRLARSTRDLLNIVNLLDEKRVDIRVIDQSIDTGTPAGRLMISMLGAIAEFENDLRRERQAEGVEVAKRKGVVFGRKASLQKEEVDELRIKRKQGRLIKDLMIEFSLSKASVYRYLKV